MDGWMDGNDFTTCLFFASVFWLWEGGCWFSHSLFHFLPKEKFMLSDRCEAAQA